MPEAWGIEMQAIQIDFQWTRFTVYRVQPEPPPPPDNPRVRKTLLEELAGSGSIGPTLIAQGPSMITRPIDAFPDLYLKIAAAQPTAEGHSEFAKTYGLLTDMKRESLFTFKDMVEQMRRLVQRVQDRTNWPVQDGRYLGYEISRSLSLQYKPDIKANSITLSVAPRNLWIAAAVQCIFRSASGAKIKSCKACGKPFEVGGSSGARSHRETCSDKCRFEFSKRKRK
ncbi:hypothetical protein [Methylocystis echinoides]|uniref:hypothetical protein n=1 Tax=Methylocystis echinoides TaxID=29468 RepID=UPI0034325780